MVPLSIDYGTYNGWINEWIKEKYVLQGYLYRKNVPDNEYMLEILQVVETLHPGRQKEKKTRLNTIEIPVVYRCQSRSPTVIQKRQE
jgi:hypothetical protein